MASTCLLKNIPPDIFVFVQREQNKIKEAKGINKYSFERTIYKMLKDYQKCCEDNNFKPEEE